MDFGYEPIIAIICTFRSLISNILRRFKDSTKARNIHLLWGEYFVYLSLCNPQSEKSCDIPFIYVKLPNLGYSQCITSWVIFSFCYMISPPDRPLDNDWLNPYDLFINSNSTIPPELKRFCICWIESCCWSDTAFLWLIHLPSPLFWNLSNRGAYGRWRF